MKKLFSVLLTALLAAGLAASVSAEWEENVDYINLGDVATEGFPNSLQTQPECITGQLLRGDVITSVYGNEDGTNPASYICDGDQYTSYWCHNLSWVGYMFDQAYELTEIRIGPNPELAADKMGGVWVQGSNDGIN